MPRAGTSPRHVPIAFERCVVFPSINYPLFHKPTFNVLGLDGHVESHVYDTGFHRKVLEEGVPFSYLGASLALEKMWMYTKS